MTEAIARPIEAEARIRAKNQVTLPDRIAEAMDARQDDVLIFETDPNQPGVAVVHLVRRGFAGALTGTTVRARTSRPSCVKNTPLGAS